MNKFKNKGFTLIELILVIVMIGILAGVTYVLINPQKRFKETRNAQRTADVNAILNASYQYYVDNDGALLSGIQEEEDCFSGATYTEICKTGVAALTCLGGGLTTLSALTENEKYLSEIPLDPSGTSGDGTGYFIVKNSNSRVTVCAPSAEEDIISISR